MYKKTYIIIIACFLLVVLVGCSKGDGEMSDQDKAEQFAKEMEPTMTKQIHAVDYNHFVNKITFTKVSITPLGDINVDGYVNSKNFSFYYTLSYNNTTDVFGFNPNGSLDKKMGITEHELKEKEAPVQQNTSVELYPGTSLRNLNYSSND
ncbi:hypothetical protein [Listeria goaensis]|uniref:hypothetical protein n=1 Tax=Listeria goaensis TaxID=1649188 RepID=UPI000B58BBFB|nr:hypothetical protein [Listeria goaensis]